MDVWRDNDAGEEWPLFHDRREAGAVLAQHLARFGGTGTVVLGIPRGGVVVAAEVARRLGAPLDVLVARKLGAPFAAELAIGAVTANGVRFLNQALIDQLAVPDPYVAAVTEAQRAEAQQRELRFRASRHPVAVRGRTAILVDDGLATGATVRAAVRSLRGRQPARIVVAVPVGSGPSCTALRTEADEVVCPFELADFEAVERYYVDFRKTTDDEVQELMALARPGSLSAGPSLHR